MLGRDYACEDCSAARALALVGERWSLLILRDAMFRGLTKFSQFQSSLGLATNVLTARLTRFVDHGLMETRGPQAGHRSYYLTEKGEALKPVVMALTEWGDAWLGQGLGQFVDEDDHPVRLAVIDAEGRPFDARRVRVIPIQAARHDSRAAAPAGSGTP